MAKTRRARKHAGAEAPASERKTAHAGAEAPTSGRSASGRSGTARLTRALVAVGRRFYARQWVLGTSGNFSAVLSRRPLRLLLTASAAHKGTLRSTEFVVVDRDGRAVGPSAGRAAGGAAGRAARRAVERPVRKPSAETRLHLAVVGARGAAAVLHTHSVWGTILSEHHAEARGLAIAGYEMLKGLDGILTHEHREWIPIIDNDQDMTRLEAAVRGALAEHPGAHAFLLRGHGLYTWGASVADAERHVEILEFLFEAVGRRSQPWL